MTTEKEVFVITSVGVIRIGCGEAVQFRSSYRSFCSSFVFYDVIVERQQKSQGRKPRRQTYVASIENCKTKKKEKRGVKN